MPDKESIYNQIKNSSNKDSIIDKIIDRQNELKRNKRNDVGKFFNSFMWGIFIILIIAIINSNVIFMMKYASQILCRGKSLLDIYFPSDCNEYPYGSANNPPCTNPRKLKKEQGIDTFCLPQTQTGGGKNKWFRSNRIFRYLYEDHLNKSTKPDTIYEIYNSPEPIIKWFISSLAYTNVYLHSNIKEILHFGKDIPNPLLMLVGAIIMLLALNVFSGFYTFVTFMWNMFYLSQKWKPFFMLLLLCIIPLCISFGYSMYKQLSVVFKLMFFPIMTGGWSGILKIIKENNIVLAYAIALSMVISSYRHLNGVYADSMLYAYLFFVLLHVVKVFSDYMQT